MKFLSENWTIIVFVIVLAGGVFYALTRWEKMTQKEREETVREWLLQAVIIAEREFGGKTGALKLSSVWSEFCKTMPCIAKVISFSKFSELVDEALVKMKKMLESNNAVAAIVDESKKVEPAKAEE